MDEPMLLPVSYQGEELEFEMRLQQGYIPRVEILIDGIPVSLKRMIRVITGR
ncbi:hypothetical protein [Mucilaginibacter sp. UYCu711]|uniref:hypothetical protein n=1 Tax=Mucilaginibacter sp. UYCu711 TaxID=3156339 RepID=UPI003D240E7C